MYRTKKYLLFSLGVVMSASAVFAQENVKPANPPASPADNSAAKKSKPIKVFVLAGDENILEQAVVVGRTVGTDAIFFPGETPAKDEQQKHVNCAVYKGAYQPGTEYDKLTPVTTSVVEIGDQRTQRRADKQRGREPIPMTPFPDLALKAGYTTVLRGYFSVPIAGRYELRPGSGASAFNATTVAGKEVYRLDVGQKSATMTIVELEPKKRYPFQTIFFDKPGHDFRVPLTNLAGTLETVVAEKKERWGFLKTAGGNWKQWEDVILYDAHPIHNNTRAAGRSLQVQDAIGPELMLGHVLGNQIEEPVFLLRFATRHPIWFFRGGRSLGHDYLPPSSGGDPDLSGNWDVIHFNWGVWDTFRVDQTTGKMINATENVRSFVPIEEFEANLRQIVARMKKTGATLVWASITPLHKDCPTSFPGDEIKYNAVAEKIMRENGVIIDDLNAESLRQGFPKVPDVHSVGNLAPHVTQTILTALASRKQTTKPLPRVLMIGDSITGSYLGGVTKSLDGKAVVSKNPGNGEHSRTGVAKIEEWLDLKNYLQSGQEYLELVNGVKDSLAQLERFYPGYRNQGFEMAGLVWFHGIADNQSPAQTVAYEKNLANLIRDLRRDLHVPNLRVVVPAVGFGDGKIHDAQMAVGNPAKYPEFAANVKSVDTRPFVHPPAGRADCYNNNAESFLEIGEAMGQAMLEMMKDEKGDR